MGGWAGARLVSRAGWAAEGRGYGAQERAGGVRGWMEWVPGGAGAWGAGSVEPMRLSPSDGYQIGGARGADGLITGDDYNAFIAEYAAGTANGATDLNNNGVVDGDDFTAWNAEWDSGALVGRAIMSVPDGADAKGPGNVRGAMAAAGVALDAVLSGKVSGTSGQTGRVSYLPGAAGVSVAPAMSGLVLSTKNSQISTQLWEGCGDSLFCSKLWHRQTQQYFNEFAACAGFAAWSFGEGIVRCLAVCLPALYKGAKAYGICMAVCTGIDALSNLLLVSECWFQYREKYRISGRIYCLCLAKRQSCPHPDMRREDQQLDIDCGTRVAQ